MAITIQHNPPANTSVHGDVIFTVCDIVKSSDPITYPDYRYICDVYIGSTKVTSLKAYPHPDNKMGIFNIGNILRSYIAAVFNPTAGALRAQEMGVNEFSIRATMKFGEEYDFDLYTNVTVDSEREYFNHYDGRKFGVTSDFTSKLNLPATDRSVYTAITPTSEAYPVDKEMVNNFVPLVPTATGSITLRIKSFTAAGVEIATQDQAISPTGSYDIQVYNLSPTVINALYPGLIPLTVASYYTVQFLSPETLLDRTIRFSLNCEAKFEVFTVHFLNKYGGFESRCFTKVSRKVIDIERSEFGKLGYVLDSSGVVTYKNSNNVYNDTRTIFSTQYKEKLTLNTDILSDSEYLWLADLILSPMVYVEITGPDAVLYHIPCVITENNYEFRKRVNDKLTNLTIKIEFGENFNSQFR